MEIKIHRNLNHKNIIKFHDYFQEGNVLYVLLEHAPNGTLYFFINNRLGLPQSLATKIFKDILSAIYYLHFSKISHRDIKPENIVIDKDFNFKLIDFGWSCLMHKTKRKSVCGTFEYMPPEILNKRSYSLEIDIWQVGVLLFELLHGKTPH